MKTVIENRRQTMRIMVDNVLYIYIHIIYYVIAGILSYGRTRLIGFLNKVNGQLAPIRGGQNVYIYII